MKRRRHDECSAIPSPRSFSKRSGSDMMPSMARLGFRSLLLRLGCVWVGERRREGKNGPRIEEEEEALLCCNSARAERAEKEREREARRREVIDRVGSHSQTQRQRKWSNGGSTWQPPIPGFFLLRFSPSFSMSLPSSPLLSSSWLLACSSCTPH